ncbi:MAG: peptidylprolyl isomerase [Bacteroidota bacterium]
MNRIFVFCTLILCSLGLSNALAQPKVVDKVISVIGDKVVLHSDIEEQVAYFEAQQGAIPPDARCYVLDQMMTQQLLLVQADRDSVVVEDAEVNQQVEARISHILSLMRGDEEQFEAYYGMSVSEVRDKFREDMRNQLLTQRMQAQIVEHVNVTPSEVVEYFNKIPIDSLPYFNSEVEIAELVLKPKVNEEELAKAEAKITNLRRRIVEDREDFATLAEQYSDDTGSRATGGDLGWVKRGELVPEFEAAVFRLSKNEFSKPVRTEYGYHLIQLLERRGNSVNARHILVRPEITDNDKQLVLAQMDTIRNLVLTDSLTFIQAVRKYSEDEQSKNNAGRMMNPQTGVSLFEIGDLPPEVYFAIDTMSIGDVSGPVEFDDFSGDPTYRLLLLQSRTEPHQANLQDDYDKIQNAALEEKKVMYLSEWISKRTGQTYVFVDPFYTECFLLDKWLNP